MLNECYCVLLHLEAVQEDKRSPDIKKYNEIIITRHFYPEGSENVYVNKKKMFWLYDLERYMPVTRARGMFVEYVLTESRDELEDRIEVLKQHAKLTKAEIKKSIFDLDYPYVKKANFEGLEGYEYDPDLNIWTE